MDFFFFLSLLLITFFFIFSFFLFSRVFRLFLFFVLVFLFLGSFLIIWGPRLCGEMLRYQNTTKRPRALLLASIDSIFFLCKVATYSFELAMLLLLQNQRNLLMLLCVCVCVCVLVCCTRKADRTCRQVGTQESCQMHLQKIPARAVKTDAEGATLTKPYFFGRHQQFCIKGSKRADTSSISCAKATSN